jgi:hypothetical protein
MNGRAIAYGLVIVIGMGMCRMALDHQETVRSARSAAATRFIQQMENPSRALDPELAERIRVGDSMRAVSDKQEAARQESDAWAAKAESLRRAQFEAHYMDSVSAERRADSIENAPRAAMWDSLQRVHDSILRERRKRPPL